MDLGKPVWLSILVALAIACMAAQGAPLPSVTIWNYVGEPILVHCHDQFTDFEQQDVAHDTDYVFTFYQNPNGMTLFSCSFVWGLNKTQEFPVWKGEKVQTNPKKDCGAGSFQCLYKVSKEGFYMASPAMDHGGPSNWFFINLWKENGRNPWSPTWSRLLVFVDDYSVPSSRLLYKYIAYAPNNCYM